MGDSTRSDWSPEGNSSSSSQTVDGLNELRKMLLGPFATRLNRLQERLDRPELHAKDVSRILPEAIAMRSLQDKKIALALEPITEQAIRTSIKKNRNILVDALFPVMGPAIRKAIASTIQGMIQSFNQILEHSLSLKGIKWRLEAIRTRKSFAEVVLLHTLVYQVEQVFFIHRKTGLVLQHVVAKSVKAQDPDLVSGMLTAIRDFVQDSFGAEKEWNLETLRVGERSVWIEQRGQAILAAVIHGNPPMDFQMLLREALDEIHFKKNDELESFDGDTTPFEEIRYILDNCLQAQFKEEKRKRSYLIWILPGFILFIFSVWIYSIYDGNKRWLTYIAGLRRQPGIIVTAYEKKSGKTHISGLRDPLAPDPARMLSDAGLDPGQVIFNWEPYHSVYPEYANRRINAILKPPDTIKLELKDGILHASGSARQHWLIESAKWVELIPWIKEFQAGDVVDIDREIHPPESVTLEIKGNTLSASGSASHQWIIQTRQSVKSLPGISHFQEKHLIDADLIELDHVKKKLESRVVYFEPGLDKPLSGQEGTINHLIDDIKKLLSLADVLGRRAHIEISGHADSSGPEEKNLQISRKRAEAFRSILVSKGISAKLFTTRGVGSKIPLREETTEQQRVYNRSVTFGVTD